MAMSRLRPWLRSFWQATTMPLGKWVMRTADEVLLTFCPPAPEARKVSMRMSVSLTSISMSSSISGVDEHRGEGGVAARGGVEGADAHQPMHAGLGLQVAVGVLAAGDEVGALDARLVAGLEVGELHLPALALCVAAQHAQEHRRPVAALGAACAGVDGDDGRRVVVGSAEHPRQLHLLDLAAPLSRTDWAASAREASSLRLVGEIQQHLGVLEGLPLLLPSGDRLLGLRLLPQQRLGLEVLIPEVGLARLGLYGRDASALAFDVKAAPGAPRSRWFRSLSLLANFIDWHGLVSARPATARPQRPRKDRRKCRRSQRRACARATAAPGPRASSAAQHSRR